MAWHGMVWHNNLLDMIWYNIGMAWHGVSVYTVLGMMN